MSRLDGYHGYLPSKAERAEHAAWSIENDIEEFAASYHAFVGNEIEMLKRARDELNKLIAGIEQK